jgi:hypothetical protein
VLLPAFGWLARPTDGKRWDAVCELAHGEEKRRVAEARYAPSR